MGTVRVRRKRECMYERLACACSAGAGEYWSKQSFAHLFATKCAANATFYGSGVTLWISGDTGLQILQILQILERAPEIPGYLGGLRDHVRSGIPVPILAGATAATCVLETSCNILPYVRLNYPYQHTSSYASTRYL